MKFLPNADALFGKQGRLRSLTRPLRRKVSFRIKKARADRARNRTSAKFVAVTGSSGKTTATALVGRILQRIGSVRQQYYSNVAERIVQFFAGLVRDDEFVVLEAAVGKPGDMKELAAIIRPDVAIVTLVALDHYSAFRGKQAIAAEKGELVEALPPDGLAVLNVDDENVAEMAARTKARVVTFGETSEADYRIVSTEQRFPEPLKITISWKDGTQEIVSQFVGEYFALPIAAAFAAAVELGVAPDLAAEAISTVEPLRSRCEPVRIDNGPTFLLDTAKAPWESITLPMQTVEKAAAARKRIVIGQMSDYPGNSNSKYRDTYLAARAVADQVIFVGNSAHKHRADKQDVAEGRIVEIRDAQELFQFIKDTAIKDELILLKSSQNLHLERVALAMKHDVRCWVDRCGISGDCVGCGLYGFPFEQHGGSKRKLKKAQKKNRLE